MLAAAARPLVRMVDRYLPDPFIFVLLLTLVVFAAAIGIEGTSPVEIVRLWGDGFWELLTFSMQMLLVLVTGYMLASSPPVRAMLQRLAARARTPGGAIVLVSVVSLTASWINWGFGLVVGALFAKELARQVRVDYRLLVASAYSGFVVWHGGLAGSVPLAIATSGHPFEFGDRADRDRADHLRALQPRHRRRALPACPDGQPHDAARTGRQHLRRSREARRRAARRRGRCLASRRLDRDEPGTCLDRRGRRSPLAGAALRRWRRADAQRRQLPVSDARDGICTGRPGGSSPRSTRRSAAAPESSSSSRSTPGSWRSWSAPGWRRRFRRRWSRSRQRKRCRSGRS